MVTGDNVIVPVDAALRFCISGKDTLEKRRDVVAFVVVVMLVVNVSAGSCFITNSAASETSSNVGTGSEEVWCLIFC